MFVCQGHGGVPTRLQTHASGELARVVVVIGTVVHITHAQLGHLVDRVRQVLLRFTPRRNLHLDGVVDGDKRKEVGILKEKSNRLPINRRGKTDVRNLPVFGHGEETAVFELLQIVANCVRNGVRKKDRIVSRQKHGDKLLSVFGFHGLNLGSQLAREWFEMVSRPHGAQKGQERVLPKSHRDHHHYHVPEKQHVQRVRAALRQEQIHVAEVATPHFVSQRHGGGFLVLHLLSLLLANHVDHAVDRVAGEIVVEEPDGVRDLIERLRISIASSSHLAIVVVRQVQRVLCELRLDVRRFLLRPQFWQLRHTHPNVPLLFRLITSVRNPVGFSTFRFSFQFLS